MDAAHLIRDAIAEVERIHEVSNSQQSLSMAVKSVKQFQSRRFAATYKDLLAGGPYQGAATFFLAELYSDASYSTRDAQFARIAGAIQRMLPKAAVETAVCLANLHALTERLDLKMGQAWIHDVGSPGSASQVTCYAQAWRRTGDREARQRQLDLVLKLGKDLERLTRTPGLRTVLKMMRAPAQAAGLAELQHFLEQGFDTFARMGQHRNETSIFLNLIERRESEVIRSLFGQDPKRVIEYLAFMGPP